MNNQRRLRFDNEDSSSPLIIEVLCPMCEQWVPRTGGEAIFEQHYVCEQCYLSTKEVVRFDFAFTKG